MIFDSPEACNTHEGAVQSEQGAGLYHVLLSEARVPRASFLLHVAIIGHVGAAWTRQDGNELQQQLSAHLPQHWAAFPLTLAGSSGERTPLNFHASMEKLPLDLVKSLPKFIYKSDNYDH